jgi:NCAIR mutase (PurE)-related protein
MTQLELEYLLNEVKSGEVAVADAVKALKSMNYKDLGHTKIDTHRELRNGYPEIIYGGGKTPEQIRDIAVQMAATGNNVLATRVSKEVFEFVQKDLSDAVYHDAARIISVQRKQLTLSKGSIAILSAGTSDMAVCEEAAVTAEMLGNRVMRIYDVGIAGIHRLFDKLEQINEARVLIVVAGMEGALASAVSGLVDKPVIAVPTSVGYGASFGGIAALLGMLTSCASGVSVVNIDNGFGAAYAASMINKL